MKYLGEVSGLVIGLIGAVVAFLVGAKELSIGLIGALIGGAFTWVAAIRSHNLEVASKKKNDEQVLINTLSLIRAELTVAWGIYQEEFSNDLVELPYGRPYLNLFPVGANPFPIYDSAPPCLAELPPELAKDVVYFYVRAKGLIEMINVNNNAYLEAGKYARESLIKKQPEDRVEPFDAGQFYAAKQYEMGVLLNMGGMTESLKALTVELEFRLTLLQASIDGFIGQAANQE